MLVVMLALAPAVQAQTAASHPDHTMAEMQMAEAHAQHADCCPDAKGGDHAGHAICGTCVLPCMTAAHAVIENPLTASPFGAAAHHGARGQLFAGLSTAPDLEPPKTRS